MKPLVDLFTDIFTLRDSRLGRQDARVKLAIALVAITCTVLSRQVLFPLTMAAASVVLLGSARVPARFVLARLAPPLATAVLAALLRAFLTEGAPLLSFSVAGHVFTATVEGASSGGLLAARVLGAATVVLLLGSVTPAHDIFRGLRWLRVPAAWVDVGMLMYRYAFVMVELATSVATAQRLRLGYSGLARSLSSAGVLAGTVIVGSMDQAARTHEAMTLRGYTGEIPWARLRPLRRTDRVLLVLSCVALVGALAVAELWGGR